MIKLLCSAPFLCPCQVVRLGLGLRFMVLIFMVRVSVKVIITCHACAFYKNSHSFASLSLSDLTAWSEHNVSLPLQVCIFVFQRRSNFAGSTLVRRFRVVVLVVECDINYTKSNSDLVLLLRVFKKLK